MPADITDPPLPQLKDFQMVVRIREKFPFPGTNQKVQSRDTESIFLIGPDGWATERLLSRGGRCAGEEKLHFENGKVTSRERYLSIDAHPVFAPAFQHRHKFSSSDSFEYRNGKVYRELNFAGADKSLTRIIRYEYDSEGRVVNQSFDFPKQPYVYYEEQYDAIQFDYSGDSVFEWKYRLGHIADSLKFQAHYEKGQRTDWRYAAANGVQEEERSLYDSSGKIVLDEWISSRPSVQNGRIVRPDRVEFTYDKDGRPVEVRCLIRGLRCEAYYYSYLR